MARWSIQSRIRTAIKGGVVGLYSGDEVKIAFKNLEISKIAVGSSVNL